MICLRCGYCCIKYPVAILKGPKGGVELKSEDSFCKHLTGNKPGEYSCNIHNCVKYKDSPCYDFSQVEEKNSNCRLGQWITQNKDQWKKMGLTK